MASCPPDYDWARNPQGMDPCEVATRLKAVCRQDPALAPLSSGQSYSAPTAQDQTACSCSSPVYYLVSACADCQGGSFGSWSNWASRCTKPSVNFFPNPAPNGVGIPNWAYFDVGTIPSFNPAFAKANSPSPPPQPTTVKPTTSTTPPQNTPRPNPSTSTPNPPTSPSNPGQTSNNDSTTGSLANSDNTSSTVTGSASETTTGTNTGSTYASDKSSDSSTTANRALAGSVGQATGSGSTGGPQSGLNAAYSTDSLSGPGHSRIDPSQPTDSSGNPVDPASGAKKSNAGAIAGGIIGGLLFIAIVCGLAYWLIMRRRRRSHMAPSAAYLAAYGSNRPDTSMSSRPLADRSTSVLDLRPGNAERYSPYRDDEELRGSSAAVNASQIQFTHARASSLDHYQRPT